MTSSLTAINGSSIATFETDEDRLSFLVRIPCHEGEEGIPSVFLNDKEIPKETKEFHKEILDNLSSKNLSEIQVNLLKTIIANQAITLRALSLELDITVDQIRYQRKQLESKGIFLCHKGTTKKGSREIKYN